MGVLTYCDTSLITVNINFNFINQNIIRVAMNRNSVFFCPALATLLLLKNEFHATRYKFIFIRFIFTNYLLSKSWYIQHLLPFLRKPTSIFLASRKTLIHSSRCTLAAKTSSGILLFLVPVFWQLKFLHVLANLLMLRICNCIYYLSRVRFILVLNFGKLIPGNS